MPVRFTTPRPRSAVIFVHLPSMMCPGSGALENARAPSPATAPSMPVPAFYAAPARNVPGLCLTFGDPLFHNGVLHAVTPPQSLQNLPGYPSFGGLQVSL